MASDAEKVLAAHLPVIGRFMQLNGIVGCQCMDRVFFAGQEDYPSHLAAVLEAEVIRPREREALLAYRDALVAIESAENWIQRDDYLHDITDWAEEADR